jgi:hypothetical protein
MLNFTTQKNLDSILKKQLQQKKKTWNFTMVQVWVPIHPIGAMGFLKREVVF